ncbi:hypothetical protein CMUS01_04003 [Colletotrichum musicola]|uniref:Uncharacterized protein n=1 Tax=Colletotrichum musicola TaxID=2175873 RepID=A0A8H6U4A3_9PEZI|nr:hypothetical protein CMUS01_04003 [Colletotrichum musicola]
MMGGRHFLSENSDAVHHVLTKHIAALDKTLQLKALCETLTIGVLKSEVSKTFAQSRLMEARVQDEKDGMFQNATTEVEDAVNRMLLDLETMIRRSMNQIVTTMEQDYTGLIGTAATEADKRDRKILQPVLDEFYKSLVFALNAEAEAEVVQDADMAYNEDEGDGEEHSLYDDE